MLWVGGDLKYPLVPAPVGTQPGKTGIFGKYHLLNVKNKHGEVQGVTFPPQEIFSLSSKDKTALDSYLSKPDSTNPLVK